MKRILIHTAITAVILLTGSSRASCQSDSMSNPTQHAAIELGNDSINSMVSNQSTKIQKTSILQGAIGAEFLQMKSWEAKYNAYLKDSRGFAEALKAGSHLYSEGVAMLMNLNSLRKAITANPEGIAATMSMNTLYVEAYTAASAVYDTLDKTIDKGGKWNMLKGSERTALLWTLNESLANFNRKLRSLALSIAFYNLMDVWNKVTAGMLDIDRGRIANDAFDRWRRAQKAALIVNSH